MDEEKAKPEFQGDLKKIDPARLINEKQEDKVEEFFLTLGVIFNDLKGLVLFQELVQEGYRKAPLDEVSPHAGELGGILIQIHKLSAGLINEFFEFLEANVEVLNTGEFMLILEKIPVVRKEQWNAIVDVALGKSTQTTEFPKALLQVRNNMSFHYYQAGKNLRRGFINRFFSGNKAPRNLSAFYSLGKTMSDSRFYYCDAAVEQYLFTTSHRMSGNGHDKDIAFNKEYISLVNGVVGKTNLTIYALMKSYLQHRPYPSKNK